MKNPYYIIEGPFDATLVTKLCCYVRSDLDIRSFGWSDYIYVYDNEPRNREIVNRIAKTIDRGDKVVIWPTSIVEKDINDMVLSGQNIMNMLESNTYSGLKAKIKFNNWKNMTNGTKVKKRNGSIEPLNLEKMHVMVEEACKVLQGSLQVK